MLSAPQQSGTPWRAALVPLILYFFTYYFFAYHSEFVAVNACHFSGKSSRAKIAVTGHTGTHAPQSIHSVGLIYSCVTPSCSGSSLRGWIQSTGHTSTQAVSFVPIHGSA